MRFWKKLLPGLRPQDATTRRSLICFWILVFAAMPVWIAVDTSGWDVVIYHSAMNALAMGHDPYSDATAIQKLIHTQGLQPGQEPPYSYVYSPVTLPLLRLISRGPATFSAACYWVVYVAALLTQVWIGLMATMRAEKKYFLWIAAVTPFFPGFLGSGIVLGGNVAVILYAAVFFTALIGWKSDTWRWFYLAVICASCVKAPLLGLLAIPVLSARKQWIPAGAAALAGIALFALQPLIWPSLFRHYLEAVDLQFRYNRDFGMSPAGLFSGVLWDHKLPYSPASFIFFLGYAVPLFVFLVYLSRQFQQRAFSLKEWIPLLMVGVILLNPRIMEYDVAPLALPMALIAWRVIARIARPHRTLVVFSLFFVACNLFAFLGWERWKIAEGALLVVFFVAGSWDLLQRAKEQRVLLT